MEYRTLHPWDVSPSQAIALQNELARKLIVEPLGRSIKLIAGADLSYAKSSGEAHAVFVVLDARTLAIVDTATASEKIHFPFVPGLLAFREGPVLLHAWKKLRTAPDAVMFDGQGIAHLRRMGIASHLGLLIDLPSVGCSKARTAGTYVEPGTQLGEWTPISQRGEVIEAALRTHRHSHPIFVSAGHRIDLASAIRITMVVVAGTRIPEPIRQAHALANALRASTGSKAA